MHLFPMAMCSQARVATLAQFLCSMAGEYASGHWSSREQLSIAHTGYSCDRYSQDGVELVTVGGI